MPQSAPGTVRLAAIGDVHCGGAATKGQLQSIFAQVAASADVLALCGDLTNHGRADEIKCLLGEMSPVAKLPTVAVLGNHDFESDQSGEIIKALTDAGITVLDGDAVEINGIGFAGVKGFPGGFGRGTLSAFGEPETKHFVKAAIDEALKLESALAQLRTQHRVAILHYSPIRETVLNEPLEIFPFLGCSRLEEPINRYPVTAVFHGHAHRGSPEGRTSTGVPVYNVALPLMRATYPDRPAFRLLTMEVKAPASVTPAREDAPVETRVESSRLQ